MIKIVNGDALEAFANNEIEALAHCVNCRGVMGSGIAKQIKIKYQEVFEVYASYCKNRMDRALGDCIFTYPHKSNESDVICNLFGQINYGYDKRHLNYGALAKAMMSMATQLHVRKRIGFPYLIGCGLAGGDEEIVMEMIEQIFNNHHYVTIYKLGDKK